MAGLVHEIVIRSEVRPCVVNGKRRALLHEIRQGYATVEYEDGSFGVVHAESVRTLDSDEVFGKYAWEEER